MFEDKLDASTVEDTRKKLDDEIVKFATLLRAVKELDERRKELMTQIGDSRLVINSLHEAHIDQVVDTIYKA